MGHFEEPGWYNCFWQVWQVLGAWEIVYIYLWPDCGGPLQLRGSEVSIVMGVPLLMNGLEGKILLKWMIWGYPHLWNPPICSFLVGLRMLTALASMASQSSSDMFFTRSVMSRSVGVEMAMLFRHLKFRKAGKEICLQLAIRLRAHLGLKEF